MKEEKKELEKWLEDISSFHFPNWEALPEMDLYMDQVVSYMDKKMNPFHADENDKILTPFMVNNYVKSHLIDSPQSKKYNRDHLAYLLTICSVKQVLSMSEISTLLVESRKFYTDCELLYEDYIKRIMDETTMSIAKEFGDRLKWIEEESKEIEEKSKNDFIRSRLASTAYRLSVEAQIKKTIADRIIALIDQNNLEQAQEAKKKKEEKDKKEKAKREKEKKTKKDKEKKKKDKKE